MLGRAFFVGTHRYCLDFPTKEFSSKKEAFLQAVAIYHRLDLSNG